MQRMIFHFRVVFLGEFELCCCTSPCDAGLLLNGSLNGMVFDHKDERGLISR